MNIQQVSNQVQGTPEKPSASRGKKAAIIAIVTALILAGGAGTAFAVTENKRTSDYDGQVEKAHELIDSIKTLEATIPQAKYVFVEANSLFEKRHFSDMKKIAKANKKLVAKKTLEPLSAVVTELTDVYGEDAKESVVSESELEHHAQWEKTFEKEGTLEALLDLQEPVTTVAPPAFSADLENRLSDEQIKEAEDSVVANTEILDELQTELETYTSALHGMDDLVVAHAELLVEPATEAVENAESYAKGWDKASKKSKKKLKTATAKLEESLDAFLSEEDSTAEKDDSKHSDSEETEQDILDVFTFTHESADESALKLATDLRSTFAKFLTANTNVKKSHDEAIKKAKAEAEAAAAAAANAGASTYQNPQTGAWEPTPGWAGGGGTSGGGGGWTPPSNSGGGGSGGGGSTTPPSSGGGNGGGSSGGGGSSSGGGGYTCPGLKPGYQWSSSTHTINGVTCQNQTPLGGDADEW